jgi:hypothetical protein
MLKLLVALVVTLTIAVVVGVTQMGESEATQDRLYKDPWKAKDVKVLGMHVYEANWSDSQFIIETAIIKGDRHYVRLSSDSGSTFYCYHGVIWEQDPTGGCLGNKGFNHYGVLAVQPYYNTAGYIESWRVLAGDVLVATVHANHGTYSLIAASTFLPKKEYGVSSMFSPLD